VKWLNLFQTIELNRLTQTTLQAGQIDAVHAPSAFIAALAALASNVTQSSSEAAQPSTLRSPQSCEENSDFSSLETRDAESGILDAALKAGADLLAQGSLEGVGHWRVGPSDYFELYPEVRRGAANAADKNVDTSVRSGCGSESKRHVARHSFILVPEASIAQSTKLNSDSISGNSEQLVKYPALKEAGLPSLHSTVPMLRRASISLPTFFDHSNLNVSEPVDLLFGETSVQRPACKSWVEARLFVD
jgi:hypothetical protein